MMGDGDITASGRVGQAPSRVLAAKPTRSVYKRKLPHIQRRQKTLFVTFSTYRRWQLPESIRETILDHCLHDHGVKLYMHAAVVMPDHVHLLFTPLDDGEGNSYGLAEIMQAIKGASAHTVNRALGRRGRVWQTESFDHVLRSDESARSKGEYICANPVRAGLVVSEDEYPWLWREWIEGSKE